MELTGQKIGKHFETKKNIKKMTKDWWLPDGIVIEEGRIGMKRKMGGDGLAT